MYAAEGISGQVAVMVGRTKHINGSDRSRLDMIGDLGCLPCRIDGVEANIPITRQHVTNGGRRMPDQHQNTYGACQWHHLGVVPEWYGGSVERATQMHGPSFEHNKGAFAARYGMESELVKIQDALIRIAQMERDKGCYLPNEEISRLVRDLHREIVTDWGSDD
jgi:hypothetical protein